jgi:hypothetical protein
LHSLLSPRRDTAVRVLLRAWLWSARYPCSIVTLCPDKQDKVFAVVHPYLQAQPEGARCHSSSFRSRDFTCPLAVAFCASGSPPVAVDKSGSSYLLRLSQLPQLFQPMPRLSRFWVSSGYWANPRKLRRNFWYATPQAIFRRLSPIARHILSSASRATIERSPKRKLPHSRAPTFRHLPSVRPRHFLRGVTLDPHGSGLGCGPCPAMVAGLTAWVWTPGGPVLFVHDVLVVGAFSAGPAQGSRKPQA